MLTALCLLAFALTAAPCLAAVYWVDAGAENASDENPGTEAAPWKTLARAATAEELAPGDTVLIKTGVYRETMRIRVSGEEGRPITFAAAPGHRVVVKGSEILRGQWVNLQDDPDAPEPFPDAFASIWRIEMGDEYFTDPDFPHSYEDKSRRWISQVFIDDERALQQIGPDRIYHLAAQYEGRAYVQPANPGRGVADMIDNSFFFDPAEQMLYLKILGNPIWYNIEVGVRGWVLTATDVHDVVVRGLEVRHNRQPGGQWSMCGISNSDRVVFEDLRIYQADFGGLGIGRSRHCVLRNCDLSYNGNTGLNMGWSEDILIEDCTLMFNNYRRFRPSWHAGGMKCIPGNKRVTVRGCEASYNINSDGIWFDADNEDIRIVDNVSHHNDGCGVFFEINAWHTEEAVGGVIAGNLVYRNGGRGIYISGSRRTLVAHNTVACNGAGIVCMPRGEPYPLEEVEVRNNLLIRNYTTQHNVTRGCDLTLFMGAGGPEWEPTERTIMTNHSDHNVYAATTWTPFMRHSWNPNNTLEQWQQRFGEDMSSKLMPVEFELRGTGFRLLTTEGLDVAGPLPEGLDWQPQNPARVGSAITQWPRLQE